MNGSVAGFLNRVASIGGIRSARKIKRLWRATPHNRRHALRGPLMRAAEKSGALKRAQELLGVPDAARLISPVVDPRVIAAVSASSTG
jgi:hypothetical protein